MSANEFPESDISEADFDEMFAEGQAAAQGVARFNFSPPGEWYHVSVSSGGGASQQGTRSLNRVVSGPAVAAASAV